ncbi:hypothetical protein [Taibaiella lutea]|nr:hypothetical protein [Taibaiella lutea]
MQQNQNFSHFNLQEMKDIRSLIVKLTEAVQPKLITGENENKEEYMQYNREKRLFAGKVVEFKLKHPELSSKEVDWDEFNLLFADNAFFKSTILCLQAILMKMDNTRLAYDNEIYRSALTDYENTYNNFESGKTRYEKKYNDLKEILSRIV